MTFCNSGQLKGCHQRRQPAQVPVQKSFMDQGHIFDFEIGEAQM